MNRLIAVILLALPLAGCFSFHVGDPCGPASFAWGDAPKCQPSQPAPPKEPS